MNKSQKKVLEHLRDLRRAADQLLGDMLNLEEPLDQVINDPEFIEDYPFCKSLDETMSDTVSWVDSIESKLQ